MKILVLPLLLLAWPAVATEEPKSEAGTAFLERCLKDITENRIALLKRQAPEYAAGLSDKELEAGGMRTATKTCPCFLQIIAVDPISPGATPEENVAQFVAYLTALGTEEATPMPAALPRLTRLCGVRSSVLPQSWIAR